ncbi:uncharacterized protein Dana_GF13998 [Drosophila ananassae]|uniref:Uncharacterized protein n=1 Tax=Drosophila ananassae TaxID=7217 RepID=B3MKN1_DROAN|nr:uncharacterized protein LOC6496826 [Drosophila ananassae]EDV32544.1 uncharacterized protein Dana_GF13998 [Drosophila ananassae]KAH8328602.1 hypothetical protein KR067_011487 [Drosophila pandora]
MSKQNKEWSKATLCLPKDNLTTEAGDRARAANFLPSYETDCLPVSMACLLGWEYARIWVRDRDKFVQEREKAVKPKFIKNDFEWWLKLRKTTKKFCKGN